MLFSKVATFFLLALVVGAEKKIELQDIEEDNLRSELKNELEQDNAKSDGPSNPGTETGYNSIDFMKTGLLRFLDNSQSQPVEQQAQRYVHQYAVTEQPERYTPPVNKVHFVSPAPQHGMVGYLSNMPMQIYLVPQYYSGPALPPEHPQAEFNQAGVQYEASSGNNYNQQFAAPQRLTYLVHAQPTAAPPPTSIHPVLGYPLPATFQYDSRLPSTNTPKSYFTDAEYTDTNTIDEVGTPTPFTLSSEPVRHYNSRAPIRGQHQHPVPNLPHPNPLLLKAPPSHLSHLPRTLPLYRPYTKAVYQEGDLGPSSLPPRPYDARSHFKRRPTSLLDSYIPSSIQVEYLKRGLAKDPSSLFDALSSGRLPHALPRYVERGFLPNQMYPTAAGGVTYGHYKRNSKIEKFPHK